MSAGPKKALIPMSPSSPMVAISTIAPSCITAVIEATPPLGKKTSRIVSFRG
jgi:hypothetical protein